MFMSVHVKASKMMEAKPNRPGSPATQTRGDLKLSSAPYSYATVCSDVK